MALSEIELSIGSVSPLRGQEAYPAAKKPQLKNLYTQQEITNMILTVPDNLTLGKPIETPAGIWHMEQGIAIFDSKSSEELAKITLPDKSLKEKLFRAAAVIFQIK